MTVQAVLEQVIVNSGDEAQPPPCQALLRQFLDMLDHMGCGGVIVADEARVVEFNRMTERIIDEEQARSVSSRSSPEWLRYAIARLLRRTVSRSEPGGCALVQREFKRPLAVHTVSLRTNHSGDYKMIILVDPNTFLQPGTATLKKMFGLTSAEAKLAVEISRGQAPTDIAEANGIKIATVRSQLAAVFAKTQTQRQTELVALLARVSILP